MCQGDTLSDHSFTAEIHTTYLTKWDSVGSNLAKRSRKEHYRQQRKKKQLKEERKPFRDNLKYCTSSYKLTSLLKASSL